MTAGNGCYRLIGFPDLVCCPQGYECDKDTGRCEREVFVAMTCADYETSSECNVANVANVEDYIYFNFPLNSILNMRTKN